MNKRVSYITCRVKYLEGRAADNTEIRLHAVCVRHVQILTIDFFVSIKLCVDLYLLRQLSLPVQDKVLQPSTAVPSIGLCRLAVAADQLLSDGGRGRVTDKHPPAHVALVHKPFGETSKVEHISGCSSHVAVQL